jgi:hypothetical protein
VKINSFISALSKEAVWLPAVTDDGDRYDAALGLLLYASAPLFLAFINYLAYRFTKEGKPSGPGALRNSIPPD